MNADTKPISPTLKRVDGGYRVVGASGSEAGALTRATRHTWVLQLRSCPPEIFFRFADAKADALTSARRY